MKTKMDTLLPKIYQDHSDIPTEQIDDVVDLYFKTAAEIVKNPTRNEIAFPWATLIPTLLKTNRDLKYLIRLLDTSTDLTPEQVESIEKKVQWLKNLKEIQDNTPGFKSSEALQSFKQIPKTNPITTYYAQKRRKI